MALHVKPRRKLSVIRTSDSLEVMLVKFVQIAEGSKRESDFNLS